MFTVELEVRGGAIKRYLMHFNVETKYYYVELMGSQASQSFETILNPDKALSAELCVSLYGSFYWDLLNRTTLLATDVYQFLGSVLVDNGAVEIGTDVEFKFNLEGTLHTKVLKNVGVKSVS